MRFVNALCVAGLMAVGLSAQTAVQGPGEKFILSPEEKIMVQAVMALGKTATGACEALPAVKQYSALLAEANTQLAKTNKAVDWRTGTAGPLPRKGE
jgi:hypothetical protein